MEKIKDNLNKFGFDDIRNQQLPLSFFVPTYGSPGNGFSVSDVKHIFNVLETSLSSKQKKYLENSLNGQVHANSDYRLFKASHHFSEDLKLFNFSESTIGKPKEQFIFEGKNFSRSSLNYLLGLSFLKKATKGEKLPIILEIGGGFGTLGEIIGKTSNLSFKYINLDLPPMFLISEEYLKRCFKSRFKFFDHFNSKSKKILISSLPDFSFLPNWKIEDLEGTIDLFVNFISFQEMEPEIVQNYAINVARLKPKYILLRNMREGKQMKKKGHIGVRKPIKTEDYLKIFKNFAIVESNVNDFGYKTSDGFHSELILLKERTRK